jgi:hypothetical protein
VVVAEHTYASCMGVRAACSLAESFQISACACGETTGNRISTNNHHVLSHEPWWELSAWHLKTLSFFYLAVTLCYASNPTTIPAPWRDEENELRMSNGTCTKRLFADCM